jgi:GNAT superfamily N-acetyltransferase
VSAPTIRDATLADAAAIASIHVRCWQHAYAGMVPEPLLRSLDIAHRRGQWERVLEPGSEAAPERGATLVSVDEFDDVTGFAQVGAARGEDADDSLGVLHAIYLEPDEIGTGTGRVLLEAATQRLRDAGFTRACLEVLPANARARHVYEAAGWHAVGEPVVVDHGEHQLPHQRYERTL